MRIDILPRSDDNNGWLQTLPALSAPAPAAGAITADYAVIGAGFAGLAAARRLGELVPERAIALIEAGRIGNNAAGRCSGFAIDQAHNIRAKNFADSLDHERAQIALNRSGQDYLRQAVREQGIDCDWREEGKIHGAASVHGEDMLAAYSRNLDLLEAPYEALDAAQLRETCGTSFYTSGLFTPGTILLQPAALVRGLAATLPENVSVYEDSPVVSVDYGKPHRLHTTGATVSAQTLVLTNNGFGAGFGFYRQHMVPISTYASLTRVLTAEEAARLGGRESWGIIPADPFGTSVRRTADGRILIRNIYTYSRSFNPSEAQREWARARHRRSFENRFPMLADMPFDYTWGGPMALSRNGAPIFGKLADGVHGSLICNGVGIARGTICGKLLAEDLCGEDSELLRIMHAAGRPNRNPPAPLLGLGVRLDFARRRARAGREL